MGNIFNDNYDGDKYNDDDDDNNKTLSGGQVLLFLVLYIPTTL